jgi:hypothetical protein
MKNILLIVLLAVVAGCATPSKIIREYKIVGKESILEKETIEYDNSTFKTGRAVGLSIGVNPDTKIPEIILRYGRWESARIKSGETYDSNYSLKNINLFTGEGSAEHVIKVGPVKKE